MAEPQTMQTFFSGSSRSVPKPPGLGIPGPGSTPTGAGKYTVNPSTASANPEAGAAALTRAQYQYFLDKSKPSEDIAIADLTDANKPRQLADAAEARVNKTFSDLNGLEGRSVQAFGIIQPNADRSRTVLRKRGLEHALGVVAARNAAYNATEDFQLDGSGDALQIGRGVSGQATRDLSSAAKSFTVARDQQEAQKAQGNSNMLSTITSAAGIGLSAGAAGSLAGIGITTAAGGGALGAGLGLIAAFI
jgi:hypothetical protein